MRKDKYLTGREITQRSILAALFGLLLAIIANAQVVPGRTLQIVFFSPDSTNGQYYSSGAAANRAASQFRQGVQLGIEEAGRTGRLLGWKVNLDVVGNLDSIGRGKGPSAIVLTQGPLSSSQMRSLTQRSGVVMVAFASPKDWNQCTKLFAITGSSANQTLSLWDSTDERFGASQLNDRFRGRFHSGMDSNAWAGWITVKVLSEAAFRTGRTNVELIRSYLVNPSTRFDGHKGVPLHFAATHVMIEDSASGKRFSVCR